MFGRDIDELFNRFMNLDDNGSDTQSVFMPRVNVSETDDAYSIDVELPGMKPEEIDVEFKEGNLWISGERKTQSDQQGRTWHRVESSYGSFRRVIRLDDVDSETVEARHENGMVHITARKMESVRPRKIEVRAE
jgi:HSP20 family protein